MIRLFSGAAVCVFLKLSFESLLCGFGQTLDLVLLLKLALLLIDGHIFILAMHKQNEMKASSYVKLLQRWGEKTASGISLACFCVQRGFKNTLCIYVCKRLFNIGHNHSIIIII